MLWVLQGSRTKEPVNEWNPLMSSRCVKTVDQPAMCSSWSPISAITRMVQKQLPLVFRRTSRQVIWMLITAAVKLLKVLKSQCRDQFACPQTLSKHSIERKEHAWNFVYKAYTRSSIHKSYTICHLLSHYEIQVGWLPGTRQEVLQTTRWYFHHGWYHTSV